MTFSQDDIANKGIAEARFGIIAERMSLLNKDTTRESRFTDVFVGLEFELLRAFKELTSGFETRTLTRTACASRNLFELKFWVQFAVQSEANVWRIWQDASIDLREMLDKPNAVGLDTAKQEAKDALNQARLLFEEKCREHKIQPDGSICKSPR
jgi:hypothetical protein